MATKNLSAVITIGGTMTGGLKSALGSTASMLKDIGKTITDLGRKQKTLGADISAFGKLGQNVDKLRLKYIETTKAVDLLRTAQSRLAAADATRARITGRAGKIASAGAGIGAVGGGMVASVVPGVKEAKHYQTETARISALGLGDEETAKAVQFAKEMKTFGTSQLENLELMRDGMSVFADRHHAEMVAPMLSKMKFANKAMFGEERGGENAKQFMDMLKVIETRGGLSSESAFNKQANIIQQVISATGGRVTATEWRNLISTGGLAAKGMKDEALYYTMEHLVQEQGGDKVGTGLSALYSSLYQGRTTKRAAMNLDKYGLIGDKTKVKHDKAGQVSYMDPGALLGGQTLRDNPFEWMENVLLPALAKKGVTDKDKILDVIGSVVSNKKGADILAAMYMQREQIHKSENLNRGAHNIDQLNEEGKQTAGGKELEMQAKLADLKLQLGAQILPIYAKGLEVLTGALMKFNTFSKENPRLTKGLVIGFTTVGVALAVLAPILLTTASAMIVFAGAQSFMARAAVGSMLSGGIGMLGRALTGLASVIPSVLSVIRPLALAFVIAGAPVWAMVAAGAALVAVGVAIYKYWEPIKAFFVGFGEGIVAGMQPVADAISAAFAPVWNIIKPVVMPILETVGGWIKSAATWFGDLLTPISAASETTKSFADAGRVMGEVVAGAFTFILTPMKLVFGMMKWMAENAGGIGKKIKSVFSSSSDAQGAVEYDAMGNPTGAASPAGPGKPAALPVPAMATARNTQPATVQQNNNFSITQQPGQSGEDLAREVAKHLDRQNGVRQRSALTDGASTQ